MIEAAASPCVFGTTCLLVVASGGWRWGLAGLVQVQRAAPVHTVKALNRVWKQRTKPLQGADGGQQQEEDGQEEQGRRRGRDRQQAAR